MERKYPRNDASRKLNASVYFNRIAHGAVAGRPFSSQEAAHHLLGLPVVDSNLQFTHIDLDKKIIITPQGKLDIGERLGRRKIRKMDAVDAYAYRRTKRTKLICVSREDKKRFRQIKRHLIGCTLYEIVRDFFFKVVHNKKLDRDEIKVVIFHTPNTTSRRPRPSMTTIANRGSRFNTFSNANTITR